MWRIYFYLVVISLPIAGTAAQDRTREPIIQGLRDDCIRRGGTYSYPYCHLPQDRQEPRPSELVRLFVKWECMRDISVGIAFSAPDRNRIVWWDFPAIRGEKGDYLDVDGKPARHSRGSLLAVHVKTTSGPRRVSLGGNLKMAVQWEGRQEELGFKQLDGPGLQHQSMSVPMENGRAWIDLDEYERGTYTISVGCKFYEDYPRRR